MSKEEEMLWVGLGFMFLALMVSVLYSYYG